MKPTEISMQIVKNMGGFESVRLQASYMLDENDDINESFGIAKKQLELAFDKIYSKQKKETPLLAENLKAELKINTAEFNSVCKAIIEGKTNFVEVRKHYIMSKEVITYMKENNLI